MGGSFDPSTLETSSSRLRLADELIFAPQAHGQKTCYHVEHPSQGKFYRVGYPEYVFLSLLDGSRTVAQALTITARMLGSKALSHARGIEVATWLVDHRLASFADHESAWSPHHLEPNSRLGARFKRLNPFWMKCAFGSPDRLLTTVLPIFGWMFSAWGMFAGISVIFVGAGCIISSWSKFLSNATTVLTPHNWLWMILAWLSLKLIHELSHALACKYHGGEVRETGVILILLAPMAYVDVTSCWRFPSRWQRIHVAVAGMYAELVVAAVSAITWTYVDSPVAHHLLFNVIVLASLSTLLFNANPLMRFDGYYILADVADIPNLASDGNRFLRAAACRIFFGQKQRSLQVLGVQRWLVRCYGVAAAAWRVLICVSLVTAASVLFHGAGLVIAMFGVVSWFGVPLWKLGLDLQRRLHEQRPSFVRATVLATTLTAVSAAILLWVPWPGVMKAPVVVDYSDLSVVRCGASGFVSHMHVVDGQTVAADQLLVELRNEKLTAEQHELELSYDQELVQRRVALNQRDGAKSQIAERNLQAIEERLAEIRHRSDGLRVRAPVAGRIVARNLEQKVGTYVKNGAEILAVADEARKELVVSVGQEEIDSIMSRVGDRTRFRIGSRLTRSGRLDRLEPRASIALPHPAMSSSVGGALAVTPQDSASEEKMRLVEPRFRGVISLSPDVCRDLGAGEQGYAILGLRRENIGQFAWVRFHRWFETVLRPARS